MSLEDAAQFIAEASGKTVMTIGLNTTLKSKKFTIITDSPIPPDEAIDLLFQAFRMNGIGVIDTDGQIIISALTDIVTYDKELAEVRLEEPRRGLDEPATNEVATVQLTVEQVESMTEPEVRAAIGELAAARRKGKQAFDPVAARHNWRLLWVRLRGFPEEAATSDSGSSGPWPSVVVVQRGSRRGNGGLRLALWPDGTMLFSPLRNALGDHMVVGRIDVDELNGALDALAQSGLYDPGAREHYISPDAQYTTIMVKQGGHPAVLKSWHEVLLPGFGGNLNADAESTVRGVPESPVGDTPSQARLTPRDND